METAFINVMVLITILFLVPIVVGVYVYRDARSRRMNAPLWALVAALAPLMIGLIIYLLVRGRYADLACPSCHTMVNETFLVCPSCGTKLRPACPGCGMGVEESWKVCPWCACPLPETQPEVHTPVRGTDRGLWKVLAVLLIMPILLIVVMLLGMVSMTSGGGASSLLEVPVQTYFEEQTQKSTAELVRHWLDGIEPESQHAYAMRYVESSGEENQYFYLIYVPATGEQTHTSLGSSSGLFGRTLTLALEQTGQDGSFFCVSTSGEKTPNLKIELDGERIPCDVTDVEYNPVL